MATIQIPILGHATLPENSDVFQEPFSIKATNASINPLVWIFNNSGNKDGLRGIFTVPQDYVGSPVLEIVWTSTETSGNCIWDWSVTPRNGTEDMDPASPVRTTETVTTTKSGTALARTESRISLTAGDYAVGDVVLFELFRDTADAGDTMNGAAIVFTVVFEYSDA